ncbi:MAG: DUF3375 domain-containing protein [Chloroflexota bacterium]
MNPDQLRHDLEQSATLKLLRSPNASLILGFVQQTFKESRRVTIPHSELVERLEGHLELLREMEPDRFQSNPNHYLREWCDESHRFLRKYHQVGSDDPVYELTPDTERALIWVEDLHKKEFVGTESRFMQIFDLLRTIVEMSTLDLDARLEQLEAQKAEVQAQINEIKSTGVVIKPTTTQIKERFFDANDVARRLLSDFQEVEENFRAVAREVQEQQLQAHVQKGSIVQHVLDADEALKESDQGRSFYAFWQFLVSQTKQDELRDLLERVYQLEELPTDRDNRHILRHLKRNLLQAGTRIAQSNRRLAQQLRRLLDEQRLTEARRVQELTAEIKQLAITLRDPKVSRGLPKEEAFMTIDGLPDVNMPLERQLWQPSEKPSFVEDELQIGRAALSEAQFQVLFSQQIVDQSRLQRNVDTLLEEKMTVTLRDVIQAYPASQGLAEIVSYVSLATKSEQHKINADVREAVRLRLDLGDEATVKDQDLTSEVELPQVIFTRG